MTQVQDNAAAFATTSEAAIDAERHSTIRRTLTLIQDGKPGRARYELARSVMRQARIAGLGTHTIHPTCPCDGRCPSSRGTIDWFGPDEEWGGHRYEASYGIHHDGHDHVDLEQATRS